LFQPVYLFFGEAAVGNYDGAVTAIPSISSDIIVFIKISTP
jgi:hypothetical protein